MPCKRGSRGGNGIIDRRRRCGGCLDRSIVGVHGTKLAKARYRRRKRCVGTSAHCSTSTRPRRKRRSALRQPRGRRGVRCGAQASGRTGYDETAAQPRRRRNAGAGTRKVRIARGGRLQHAIAGSRSASPLISRYLCIIECSCEPVCLLSCRRTTLMRQETREVVGIFWAAGAAKKWSRWASG